MRKRLAQVVERQPLLLCAASVATGICFSAALRDWGADTAHPFRGWFWLLLGALAVVSVVGSPKSIRPALTVLVGLPFGVSLHSCKDFFYQNATVLGVAGMVQQPAIVDAVVDRPVVLRRHPMADQPGRRLESPWQTLMEARLEQLKLGRRFEPVRGRVLIVVDGRRDELRPGNAIRVYGSLRQFSSPTNPGERDLREAYRRRRLHARVDVDSEDQVVLLGQRSTYLGRMQRWIASFASAGRNLLLQHTDESTGPLAVALVLGQRDFVDSNMRDLLLVTGTVHLLSVSGLHLGIVVVLAGWSAAALRFRPVAKVLWILAICFLYTAITGARPPVMRACVLVATFMLALWMQRPSQPINTLALAALVLMVWNPELVFGIGVQLSFLAVATLLLCGGRGRTSYTAAEQTVRHEERLRILASGARSAPVRYLRHYGYFFWQLTWFSGCVTALSIPLVWQEFHVVSLVSVITNVVLGPLLFLALAAGVATVLLGFISDLLGSVPGWICDLALRMMHWVIETAASIPYGHLWLPSPPCWWVATFYVVILSTLLLRPTQTTRRIRYGWIVGWMCVAWILATTKPVLEAGTLEATFVDVGHGTSVILRFSKDDVWLYDCGRLGNDTNSSRDIDSTLWSLGVTRLRGVFLSHADADHFNALPGLLRRFSVSQVLTPAGMLDEPEPAVIAIRRAINASAVPVHELIRGMSVDTSGDSIKILHPPIQRVSGSDNANSLVLRIDCGNKSLILPGDLEPPGTELLINTERPPVGGVLMAPHHGSLTMDASAVLQWSRPRETIVSGGQRARRPEVHEMLAVTGSGVHVTSQAGAIRVRISLDGEVEIRSWNDAPW